ncbi:dolichyl-phosphate-mannose--protein mannosyltransferase [Agromyces mangrovi Wang et al. 2018]|uniref:dolichyl-phosphate-mannose--protein mannosyltransferase n=1 Tax=Agromyces mangrovi TaxID=1858653 RepID=UPI0025722E11|nr:phospholipid carrier-dependent glycosyltransferase [Agromyces mangrovi]BDZ63574.1 dolichyl-phosphate-mannose--protein mannosyltransferase [Agromyces mangrovi]
MAAEDADGPDRGAAEARRQGASERRPPVPGLALPESMLVTRAPRPADEGRDSGASDADDRDDRDDDLRGSALDAWWERVCSTPARRLLWYWGAPIAVTLVAAVLRFWNLGHPQQIVFDETYYVKDAWTLWNLGYEARWPEGADEGFAEGDTDAYLDEGSYVVHPPLGKWLIGLGMAAFGADAAFWWRASTALAGTLAVFIVTMVARRLTGSTVAAVLTGLFLAIDGNAIVMSRVALLDGWLMLFALLGFWFVVLDRDWTWRRLSRRVIAARSGSRESAVGPALWNRPWVLAAGAAFGAACAVKWSGVWFLAAFGLYLVLVDTLARRRLGVPFWLSGGILKQGPITFLLFVPVALVVYLASWTGWLVTDGGYYRQWAADPDNAIGAQLEWVPAAIQSLWHYHESAYGYHVGLDSEHPWQSNPLTWLLMIRPVAMYLSTDPASCAADACREVITGLGNPLLWWGAALAVGYLLYRLVRYREWQVAAILVGAAAGYLPWLAYLDRTVFQFYSIAFQPFTFLALGYAAHVILGTPDDPWWKRDRGIGVVAVFTVFAVLVSAFYYPMWTGIPMNETFWRLHLWLPGWS